MTEKNWRWKKLAFVDISKNQHQVLSIFKVMFIWKCDFIDWKISIEIEKSKLAKLFYLFYRKFYHKWDFFPMYRGTFHPISASTLCHREKFNFQKKNFSLSLFHFILSLFLICEHRDMKMMKLASSIILLSLWSFFSSW